jgi:hypothetical protein
LLVLCPVIETGYYRIVTLLLTVTGGPENAGTLADRILAAMHPPARVPENSAPVTTALVTLPDGEKVTITRAVPAGSPSCRHPDAEAAAALSAARAADLLKAVPPVSLAAGSSFAGFLALAEVVVGVLEARPVEVRAAFVGDDFADAPLGGVAASGLEVLPTSFVALLGAAGLASGLGAGFA